MKYIIDTDNLAANLKKALSDKSLVQSFSGVRTNFGYAAQISPQHMAFAVTYGLCYSMLTLEDINEASFVVGRDPRPTGEMIASALSLGFHCGAEITDKKLKIINLGIITTPLIETAVRSLKASGGVMITASHNPISDNGFKFLTGIQADDLSKHAPPGALLSAIDMKKVVNMVHEIADTDLKYLAEAINKIVQDNNHPILPDEDQACRVKAERAYLDFLGKEWGVQPHCLKPLTYGPVLVDPNGGAGCGIAARVLEHFGVRAIEINAEIGYPEHAIDTDGIDPASGKHMLLRVSRAALRNGAKLGIAFDYDADRGNIVLPGMTEESIISPQKVASLNIALALTHRKAAGKRSNKKTAIVVSDATSGASNKTARMFGAEVFTVETGEINVVTKMHQLKSKGYDVPIGVEGANGGSIFGEATCRDGLMTSLCTSFADEHPSIAKQLIKVFDKQKETDLKYSTAQLADIIKWIPTYSNIMLKIAGPDIHHELVKSRMEGFFAERLWIDLSKEYSSYRFVNYEGAEIVSKRSEDAAGGWRLMLESDSGTSFIFARGSRTEAGIWRMIVDEPDESRFQTLIDTAVSMINTAMDGKANILN